MTEAEKLEREVAMALFAADDCGAWTDDPGPHSGDCTQECHTCRRCLRDEYLAKARATITLTLETVMAGIEREARRLGPAFFADDAIAVMTRLLTRS